MGGFCFGHTAACLYKSFSRLAESWVTSREGVVNRKVGALIGRCARQVQRDRAFNGSLGGESVVPECHDGRTVHGLLTARLPLP